MTRHIPSLRRKPIGWRGDNYRHYLAAKGISTKKYFANGAIATQNFSLGTGEMGGLGLESSQEFSMQKGPRHELKGNRTRASDGNSYLHAAYQEGYKDVDVEPNLVRFKQELFEAEQLGNAEAMGDLRKKVNFWQGAYDELQAKKQNRKQGKLSEGIEPDFTSRQEEQIISQPLISPEPAINESLPEMPADTVTNEPATMALANRKVSQLPESEIEETQDQVVTPGIPENTTDSVELDTSGTTQLQ